MVTLTWPMCILRLLLWLVGLELLPEGHGKFFLGVPVILALMPIDLVIAVEELARNLSTDVDRYPRAIFRASVNIPFNLAAPGSVVARNLEVDVGCGSVVAQMLRDLAVGGHASEDGAG